MGLHNCCPNQGEWVYNTHGVQTRQNNISVSRRLGSTTNTIQSTLLVGLKEEGNSRGFHKVKFRKEIPPTSDGESKADQEAEAWLLVMKKYFRIHDYSRNEKAIIVIHNLNGRASIWWEHLMQVKGIKKRRISRERFKKYFKGKYLSTRYLW